MKEMLRILNSDEEITTEHLAEYFPEDYVRLGSPFSTLLEVVAAVDRGFDPLKAFVFASNTLPLISVLLTAPGEVFVYGRDGDFIITEEQAELLRSHYGRKFSLLAGTPKTHGADDVVVLITDEPASEVDPSVDAVVSRGGFLFLQHADKLPPLDVVGEDGQRREGIHTIRKRLGAATPTPEAIQRLQFEPIDEVPDTSALKQHLKELAGIPDATGDVLLSTVGLAGLASAVMATLEVGKGKVDSLMCSTAYGGSSQQTDILSTRSKNDMVHMERHKFNIQGAAADVLKSITETLQAMKQAKAKPVTFVQIEYPTNPDMKDTDLAAVEGLLCNYQKETGSQVLLLLDTTFSPPSKAGSLVSHLPTLVFNSLSKSVTGGFSTGGSLVANNHPLAQEVLKRAHVHLALFDTGAKPCQLKIFNEMHAECELRVQQAHDNCVKAAAAFEKAVEKHSGHPMKTNFVTAEQIRKGVTPATFSFNLPAPDGADQATRAAFAQKFVDSLANSDFGQAGGLKPCVSFGQKNSTIYATVPATSTQGVISKELTAKQALGGIQLIRFSFPTEMDHEAWEKAADAALQAAYPKA